MARTADRRSGFFHDEIELAIDHDHGSFVFVMSSILIPGVKSMSVRRVAIEDVREAEGIVRSHISATPMIRSYELEKALNFPPDRRIWLKDFGWTPSGSFKLYGGLNWMAQNRDRIGDRPVAAHSSGNFASGIAFAGMRYGVRVIVVMPETAPRIKFERTKSFGAEVLTYDIARDHETGERDRLTREIAENEGAIQASPYDDPYVIAGNGVGALEVAHHLKSHGRKLASYICPVSGGGLMAGHALAIADAFPKARIIGVEPAEADDFRRSLEAHERVRLDKPTSICDGLLSYDVGEHNWPILKEFVKRSVPVPDARTRAAMKWIYEKHGLRTEPSGAISVAALMDDASTFEGEGDVVVVLSGRNVDESSFRQWIDI
jgi:threonine dehydratase